MGLDMSVSPIAGVDPRSNVRWTRWPPRQRLANLMTFAAKTEVSPEKSRAEIERTLIRYGASHFGYATAPGEAAVMFQAHDRTLRFTLPLPSRLPQQSQAQHEQKIRSRWRALALPIKAKLECV